MSPPRVLSASDVRAALPMRDAIMAMRDAFRALVMGMAAQPPRTAIPTADGGTLLVMPARLDVPPALGAKLVTVCPDNASKGIPVVQATVVLMDPETGQVRTILDGTRLTAQRTGAVSGLATDLLARRNSHRVAILGSGVQARTQLEAIRCVREIKSVTVWSRSRLRAERFAEQHPDATVADTAAAAVRDADIICCATSATDPILMSADVGEGTHINAIGSFTPAMREVDPALLGRSTVIVDQLEAAMAEAGELIAAVKMKLITLDQVRELGAVLTGAALARISNTEITLFKSVGLAVQDMAAGAYAERAATGIPEPAT